MRVGFQGEPGAYSEEALTSRFPDATPVPYEDLDGVFEALIAGDVDAAVVPIENSQAGSIARTYDLLHEHGPPPEGAKAAGEGPLVHITGEIVLEIEHCLMALPGQGASEIERVISHPQALAQCRRFLDEHGFKAVAGRDTAGSARRIREEGLTGTGALASRQAAEDHELEILVDGVETDVANRTRFVVVETEPAERAEGPHKTSLVFGTDHTPGALHRALGPFAQRSINLVKLESRPSRQAPFAYVFHAELEGHRSEPDVAAALDELEDLATHVVVLGSYPAAERHVG